MSDPSVSQSSDSPEPSPQIQQDLTGDRNQVIGQAINSTLVNFAGEGQVINLTIYDRVPQPVSQPIPQPGKTLTQQEYRQRQVLLNTVKDSWIKGVLEASLHTKALIELGLEERANAVQRPFSEVEEFPQESVQALPEGTNVTTVFHQMGAGRTLLILGEPGSGKTITLLKLAQDLIAQVEADLSQPIPIVFNLSSWARKRRPIDQWLVQELAEKYRVSRALGKSWVETESLLLLLDGLDEVKAEYRNDCVQVLNQFMQTYSTVEVVVCCRLKDYQALAQQLRLRTAICLQPLTLEQINQYLEQAGEQLQTLRAVLSQDTELQTLATSPLLLNIMSLAYQGCAATDLAIGGTTADYRHRLLNTYVERMFQRRGTTLDYPKAQAQHWLTWLAQRLTQASQTVFLIEGLQPRSLHTRSQKLLYSTGLGFIGGIFGGLIYGLTGYFFFGFTRGVFFGLAGSITFALVYGVGAWFGIKSLRDIRTVETLKWSWIEVKHSLPNGLMYGVIFGVIFSLLLRSLSGLEYGLGFGLIYSFLGGLRGPEIQAKGYPNQGILSSAQNAAVVAAIGGVGCGLMAGWTWGWVSGLGYGLFYGLIGGLVGGGAACMKHILLRITLYLSGYSPWNLARFLDYATDRLFLQKVGGGYIFVHRLLLEHFAQMPSTPRKR
ncbi:MAG: NACHT domain-containing protein [Leptolyngbyaceae cyanobacterium bins.302]|nr:NACHT domain-containing protein [Leptolyngbyaceae cyanobacterium bins.302]